MIQHGKWSEDEIPDMTGRTMLITGANSGIGLQDSKVLAQKGARVLLGCRSPERGQEALRSVAAVAAGTAPELVSLDLGDLDSVRMAADAVRELTEDSLDVLINNAGVMAPPRGTTKDGFETQFGTNHLGHAALTWLLMPALRGSARGRVVTMSSIAAHGGRIAFDDPNFERRRYNAASGYAQSKLANQIFALELDRHLRAADETVISVAAHPGFVSSSLGANMAKAWSNPLLSGFLNFGMPTFGQSPRIGALPALYAATMPDVAGGDYYGPRGPAGVYGHPKKVGPVRAALNARQASALWEMTAQMTGVTPDPA
ncbi:MAG: short-chain dehydrogenase [Amycolatopsis sp.]|jgi:NAD(P)-dependent dehydrogenase (short-subunit alcohol dehydrogenase family)|uniref:oxidoreductase n=1 Tax=Amycolatopsis sp. TaxID=37632 RepID=UPI00260FFB9A|nr:oxidoreductase [Amycolatopsis sp.]MCU1687605.1 short-chain dehydrogenase [Amycolatopsis sp.]